MSYIRYPFKRWRHDADGYHRLIGSGGGALPAVLGSVFASEKPEHIGEFWWGIDGDARGYKPTIEEAKCEVENIVVVREEK